MSTTARVGLAQFRLVTESERGQRIQERLDALRMTARQFHQRTGISRDTLRKAVSGDPSVRVNTYEQIEAKLDQLERTAKTFGGVESEQEGDDLIEFELSGDFGVRVVVKGPLRDQAALEASVARLIRELRGGDKA